MSASRIYAALEQGKGVLRMLKHFGPENPDLKITGKK